MSDHRFRISEKTASDSSVTYDTNVYNIAVTVTDYGVVTVYLIDRDGNRTRLDSTEDGQYHFKGFIFKNTVKPTGDKSMVIENSPFIDVQKIDYFYDSVKWAIQKLITMGTSETTFSPDQECTRAQMVTFLWRAKGSPEPTTTDNSFTDVKSDAYYYRAVLWAAEQGITTGTSDSTFSPEATVNRAQSVTFLWRMEGSQSVTVDNPFVDIDLDAYYIKAISWAVKNGITTGKTASLFAPEDACVRAQIVTFLYRDLA